MQIINSPFLAALLDDAINGESGELERCFTCILPTLQDKNKKISFFSSTYTDECFAFVHNYKTDKTAVFIFENFDEAADMHEQQKANIKT